jgi:hypothetical protein
VEDWAAEAKDWEEAGWAEEAEKGAAVTRLRTARLQLVINGEAS